MSYGTVSQAHWFEAANDVGISRHAFKRANQRGIQLKGLHLVLEFGEPVDDGYLMTHGAINEACLLYTSPSPRDRTRSRMPSSA